MKFYKTRDPGGFMSNYYKARFYIYGRWWICVEAPYQAKKCVNPADFDAIHQATKANDARNLGQQVEMRPDWNDIRVDVMYECCLAKFLQHKDLRDQLMATGEEELIEDSPYDSFWGCGPKGDGKNMLGQVLMRIRNELKGE
jgi:N-glycosidase YbiA